MNEAANGPTARHHKYAVSVCVPLYIGHPMLLDGHSSSNENATATLIGYKGRKYALTCRHVVLDAVKASPGCVPRFHLGRAIYSMGGAFRYIEPAAPKPSIIQGAGANDDQTPDVAIADITDIWTRFEAREKVCIELETLNEPDWLGVKTCIGSGFLSEHKEQTAQHVVAKLALIVADLVRVPVAGDETIYFQSVLEDPHQLYFSGTSGGPVFVAENEDRLHPIGVIVEGWPGSKKTATVESIMGDSFLAIGALRLSPDTFDRWLKMATSRI